MRWRILIAFLSLGFYATASPSDSISVYLFLREDCVICQQYSIQLEQLYKTYGGKGIHFLGVFPNASSTPELLTEFAEKYKISFTLETDPDQSITQRMGATVTPEAVIFDHRNGQILYSGRIDNRYVRVGKRRSQVQNSELEAALNAIRSKQPIGIRKTEAIGCLITLLE